MLPHTDFGCNLCSQHYTGNHHCSALDSTPFCEYIDSCLPKSKKLNWIAQHLIMIVKYTSVSKVDAIVQIANNIHSLLNKVNSHKSFFRLVKALDIYPPCQDNIIMYIFYPASRKWQMHTITQDIYNKWPSTILLQ